MPYKLLKLIYRFKVDNFVNHLVSYKQSRTWHIRASVQVATFHKSVPTDKIKKIDPRKVEAVVVTLKKNRSFQLIHHTQRQILR